MTSPGIPIKLRRNNPMHPTLNLGSRKFSKSFLNKILFLLTFGRGFKGPFCLSVCHKPSI